MSEVAEAIPVVAPAPPARLKPTLVRGAAWITGANTIASLLSSLVGFALARILTPADFGIQTAIVTITAFFTAVTDTALGTAVVQREDLDQRELSSVFWTGLGASILIFAGLTIATPLFMRLFTSAELRLALPVAALSIVAIGVSVVPAALLRRRLAFSTIARAQATGAGVAALTSIFLAAMGAGYWALVLYSVVSASVSAVIMVRAGSWLPSATFAWRDLIKIRRFSGSMVGFLTVNYWGRNLDDLLIGRFLGIDALGVFALAQRFVGMPLQLLTGGIVPLLHPTFAAMGEDTARQKKAYLNVVRVTALVTFPAAAMVWAMADVLVAVVAGPKWSAAAGVVRALALLAAVQPVNMLCGPVFMARNSAHVMLRVAAIGSGAVVTGMLIGLSDGVAGVAWGYSISYALVSAPLASITAFRLLGGSASELAAALVRPLLIAAAVLVGEAMLLGVAAGMTPVASLLLLGSVSAAAFIAIVWPTAVRLRAETR